MITGFDILFFWVARMVMMGIEFMGDVPFREVYIHALVRDAERKKMSKTRGNVLDPLEVTEKYGTDAVRMALLVAAAPGTDIALSDERMVSARAFANKIWNGARFVSMNMERCGVEPLFASPGQAETLEDRWMFSRLNACTATVNRAIEQYRYHEAAQSLWHFFWHELCDWYLEIKKLRFVEGSGLTGDWRNLLFVFETALRLLHPFMPFLTEELRQRLTGSPEFVALASYPRSNPELDDQAAERDMAAVQEIITAARNLRAEMKADPRQQLDGVLYSQSATPELDVIQKLANVKLELAQGSAPSGAGALRSTPEFDLVLRLPMGQVEAQRKRLDKQIEQLDKVIESSRRQLADQEFLGRAPARVVESIRLKLADYEAQLDKSRIALEGLPRA
jgi:valyl-tRNA synthetase